MPSASDVARILSAAQSDVGRTRTENQDAFGEFSTSSGERLFVVADGMGGHRGGATASRLCVETIGRAFADGSETAQERLRIGIELANTRIHAAAESDSELAGMGTTAVALVLAPDGSGALGWVGDSRVYRFCDGSLERLSTDHSVVGEMVRAGVITEEEAESHPRRNELLRAIGPHTSVEPETLVLRHKPGDRFLLCSDGLWGPVPEAELAIVLGYETPELAVKKLIAMANERGGPDNVTAQIASIADPSAEMSLPPPIVAPAVKSAARARTLPLLAAGASVAAAALIALAVYGLRQRDLPEVPVVATAPASEPSAPPSTAALSPAAVEEPPPPAVQIVAAPPEPLAKPVEQKAVMPKATVEPAKPAAAPAAKPVVAKPVVAKPVAAKPEPAKPPAEKPAAEKPAAQVPPAPPVLAEAPREEPPPPALEAPVQPSATASGPLSRDLVERFLADWETAISSKDFGLYARLGLPLSEESFQTHYVVNAAKIDFVLHDFDQSDPDKLVVRVQMVLETEDPSGTRRVDEERSFIVKQVPSGLRYVGVAKP